MQTVVVSKAAVVYDNKILLIKRSETDERRPLQWDLPGGWVDEGETVEAAVVREIKEETGLVVAPSDAHLAYSFSVIEHDRNVVRLFYIVQTDEPHVTLSNEHVAYEWFSLSQAMDEMAYPMHKQFFYYIVSAELL